MFTSGPTASEATNSVTPTTDACSTRSTSSGTPTTTRSTSTTAGSICRANCAGSTSAAACRQPISTSEAAITTGSRSTCSNTAAPNYIYNAPRILAESGERFYGTAGAIPAAGGSGPRYPGLARPCKQGPEYDFGALFITYLSGSPHSTAQGTRTIICRAIS